MSGAPCHDCKKTAYPLESVIIGNDRWHKLCFKCTECKTPLNVKTVRQRDGGAYCEGCGNARFDKNKQSADTLEAKLNKERPKLAPVNDQLRGESVGQKTLVGVDSMAVQGGLTSPRVGTVNDQVRGKEADQQKNSQNHF